MFANSRELLRVRVKFPYNESNFRYAVIGATMPMEIRCEQFVDRKNY